MSFFCTFLHFGLTYLIQLLKMIIINSYCNMKEILMHIKHDSFSDRLIQILTDKGQSRVSAHTCRPIFGRGDRIFFSTIEQSTGLFSQSRHKSAALGVRSSSPIPVWSWAHITSATSPWAVSSALLPC